MASKRTLKIPQTPHIIVGFSYPNRTQPDEIITGSTRYGIQLSLSSGIYARLISFYSGDLNDAKARELAEDAFRLTGIYMERLDRDVAKLLAEQPPTVTNNSKS